MEELGFPVVQTIKNDADWANMQGIVKKVLKELKKNKKNLTEDLNSKEIEGIKVVDPRFFKLESSLVELLASNYQYDDNSSNNSLADQDDKQLFILNEKSVLLEIQKTGEIGDDILQTIEDPFKGLAELTQSFSGEDLFFFASPVYHYVRHHYKRGSSSFIIFLLRASNIIERLYYRFIRIIQGRAMLKTPW